MDSPERKRWGPITVLMMSRRFRWWSAAVIGLPMLYALSVVPLLWVYPEYDGSIRRQCLDLYFRPARLIHDWGPQPVPEIIEWYDKQIIRLKSRRDARGNLPSEI